MASLGESAQRLLFTIALTGISRFFVLRDMLLRYRTDELPSAPFLRVSRHTITSGKNQLDAVLVTPAAGPPQAALLLCHGIGERVHYWYGVQQLLAAQGVASLIFDYSGYGRSTGLIQARQLEEDAVSAFQFLSKQSQGATVSILGFSLGTGIVVAIIPRIDAHAIILCSSFTSFRKAAARVGLPRWLSFLAPDLWDSQRALRQYVVPVLLLHGEKDRLFPVRMAAELHDACGGRSTLHTFPHMQHDDPYYRPNAAYWQLVADVCLTAHRGSAKAKA